MDFRKFFMGMDPEARKNYGERVGLSPHYILCHLVGEPPRKCPPLDTIMKMIDASDGKVSEPEMIAHFKRRKPRKGEQEAAAA
jgi:hypothetical protein